jgi:hypothetical protein
MTGESEKTSASNIIRDRLPTEIQAVFSDPALVKSLACGNSTEALYSINDSYAECDPHHFGDVFKTLIDAAGCDEINWGTDERDATLVIAKKISGSIALDPAIDTTMLYAHYTNAVSKLEAGSDYFGAPYSLYEMGGILATAVGPTVNQAESYHTRMVVREAWSKFFPNIADEETRELSRNHVENLVTKILPVQVVETRGFYWARERPSMNEASTQLHDSFMDEIRVSGSFKARLYGETPLFQAEMVKHNITLDAYWNTTNTQQTITGLQALSENPALKRISERFDAAFTERYNIGLEEFLEHPEVAGIMSDQIQSSIQAITDQMKLSLRSPEETYDRLINQTKAAQTANKPNRILRPVRKFIESFGLGTVASGSEAESLLSDPVNRSTIIETLSDQANKVREEIALAASLFPESPYRYFELMSRGESDLYAADDTRDCTAYHLENGFNGWTVPHWLANPGFNMAYIKDDEGRIAKIGLLLAVDDKGPRLVVDSIETSKSVGPTRTASALYAIQEGLQELQLWADAQGLGDIMFCTYTNSEELTLELPVTQAEQQPSRLEAFGSKVGLQEYWQHLRGNETETISLGYLQSRSDTDTIADNDEDQTLLYPAHTYENRIKIDSALKELEYLLSESASDAVSEAARNGDWEEVILSYVKDTLPTVYVVFGDNELLYSGTSNWPDHIINIITGHMLDYELVNDMIHGLKQTSSYEWERLDQKYEVYDISRDDLDQAPVKTYAPFVNQKMYSKLMYEAQKLTLLLRAMDRTSAYIPPDDALARIYGYFDTNGEHSSQYTHVPLRTNHPIIKRSLQQN